MLELVVALVKYGGTRQVETPFPGGFHVLLFIMFLWVEVVSQNIIECGNN